MTSGELDIVPPVREFLDRHAGPGLPTAAADGWDAAVMSGLVEIGLLEVTRPERRGGLGIPLSATRGVAELAGERLVSAPLAEQLVLPAFLDVPEGSVLALADPAISEDWAADLGRVRLSGDHLDGTIELVRFAGQADHIVVVAGDDDGRTALVVVPADAPMVTVTGLTGADPCARYARVQLHQRPVAPNEVLATGAAADTALIAIRTWSRVLAACELSGIARRVLADTVEYTSQRVQFSRPIGSFQAVKHIVAGMAQSTHALDALCSATVDDIGSGPDGGRDGVDVELAGWTLKAYAARAGRAVCEDALQMHGGVGFTAEHDLHRYLGRAFALRTWYGDEHELVPVIGSRRLSEQDAA